jgi:urease accessory protein
MPWHAHLQLDYTQSAEKTVARHQHDGPLRILQSLYPEGDAVCHNVLVHPPGGLVGGDTLNINITASGQSHGLITTPGATRFYKSEGELALQRTHIQLHDQSRVEWLPMEAICYNRCQARNELRVELSAEAEFIGWDVTAFGLPHAQLPFEQGRLRQHIEVPGVWLERGLLDAQDARLMKGPVGLSGHCCLASVFFITGKPFARARRQHALDAARALIDAHSLQATAGATSPNDRVVVVRALAPVVEPAMQLLRGVWAAWRAELWGMPSSSPRIWAT